MSLVRLSPQDIDALENARLDALRIYTSCSVALSGGRRAAAHVQPEDHPKATARTITVRTGKRRSPSGDQLVGM